MLDDIRNGKYRNKLAQPIPVKRLHDMQVNPVSRDEYAAGMQQYEKDRAAYLAEDRRLHDLFVADLHAAFDMSDNPKASLLFEKSWSLAHALENDGGNLEATYHVYADLVALVK